MHPGTLELVDGSIRYRLDGSAGWELPIGTIRVIGEATNDHGPFLDDYFLCFATDANNWYEASFYAEGRDEFLKSLASVLGSLLETELIGSTDYDSNVLWPPHLAGMKMFSYKPVQVETWFGRLFGCWSNTQWFSDEVLAELQGQGRTSVAPDCGGIKRNQA
jgi:hypothetical protein